jgi:pimeloyl-ACP methyl ester carboxylesterase
MPRIAVGDCHFYYQQTGRGPDVVLIHGITGNMAVWPLIDLIDNLAVDFRATYFDLRGHGYSDTPQSGYTSADMAGDLRGLQQALGLGPMYLVGHSFGAVVALHAAVLYPDEVQGVVLSDAYFPALHHLQPDITRWEGWQDYKAQTQRAGLEVSPDDWFDVGKLCRQAASLSPERLAMFLAEVGRPGLARLVRLAATTCGADVRAVAGLSAERIVSVRQPVLALYGERSPFLATCRFLHEHLPNCKLTLVPGARHLAHEENPQEFVALVQKYLRQMAGIAGDWHEAEATRRGRSPDRATGDDRTTPSDFGDLRSSDRRGQRPAPSAVAAGAQP